MKRPRIQPIRRGDFVSLRHSPRTVPSTPFTEQARIDLEKIRVHEIEQAKKRFGR
jgi:hypothetical protein